MRKHNLLAKPLLALLLITALFTSSLPLSAINVSEVYLNEEKRNEVILALQNDQSEIKRILDYYNYTVVEDSLAPVYNIDLLDYSRNEVIDFVLLTTDDSQKDVVYTVKLVDKNDEYAGNIKFYVRDNVAHHWYSTFKSDDEATPTMASCSYADHAERIRKCLGLDTVIPDTDVKYVLIDYLGDYFYIHNSDYSIYFAVGYMPNEQQSNNGTDRFIDDRQLKVIGDRYLKKYNNLMEQKEQWEKEHPGEIWDYDGGYSISNTISFCSEIDNIIDIDGYFKNAAIKNVVTDDEVVIKTVSKTVKPSELEIKTNDGLLIGIIIASAFSAVCLTVLLVVIYRKKRIQ